MKTPDTKDFLNECQAIGVMLCGLEAMSTEHPLTIAYGPSLGYVRSFMEMLAHKIRTDRAFIEGPAVRN